MALRTGAVSVATSMFLGMAGLPAAWAQAPEATAPSPPAAQPAPAGEPVRASALLGRVIDNELGWRIGKIDDLVIDAHEGSVKYVVLTAGTRFEAGDAELALALPDERLEVAGERVTWHADLEALRDLPWVRVQVQDTEEAARKRLASARALIGAPMVARDGGGRLGKVKDLVVDLKEAKMHFMVGDHDLSWREAGRMVALPAAEVRAQARAGADGGDGDGEGDTSGPAIPERVSVVVDRGELEARPPFDDPRWPGLSNESWLQRMERLLSPG